MPNIRPVSELRNYGDVLRDVAVGAPVFLTKNGHGRYAVLDIEEYKEYEKMLAMKILMTELDKGQRSGEEKGWLDADEVRAKLDERYRGENTLFLACHPGFRKNRRLHYRRLKSPIAAVNIVNRIKMLLIS